MIGADLGQAHDPTAVAIIHHTIRGTGEWRFADRGGKVREELERERFDLLALKRLPLRTSYPEIVAYISDLQQRAPFVGNSTLIMDETGVGRAVADIFEAAGVFPLRLTITAGSEVSTAGRRIMVPKTELISCVDAKLSTGALRLAAEVQTSRRSSPSSQTSGAG